MERKIIIEEKEVYQEDYQMRMLQVNHIEGLLPVRGRGVDGCSHYEYEVSGKVSVEAIYEKSVIGGAELKCFLECLRAVLRDAEKYLLDIHSILLKPEYIYYGAGRYYFCYYPPGKGNLWEAFHTLTEYFVKQADYEDEECVRIAFQLHKQTMEENYSLEQVISGCLKEKSGECLKENSRQDEPEKAYGEAEYGSTPYDTEEHDWITRQEMGSSILRETDNMWTPVKRFLGRHKKPKWGDWDGLYIEEDL